MNPQDAIATSIDLSDVKAERIQEHVREYYRVMLASKTPAFHIEPRLDTPPSRLVLLLGIFLLVVAPAGIITLIIYFVRRAKYRKKERHLIQAATAGTLRVMSPYMINSAYSLRQVDMAVGVFEGLADDGPELPSSIMNRVLDLSVTAPDDHPEFGPINRDLQFQLFRRRRIGAEITAQRLLAVFDLGLYGVRLPGPRTLRERYFVMVEPGRSGCGAFIVPDVVIRWAADRAAGRNGPMPPDPLLA